MGVAASDLPLERVYRWEREQPNRVFLTQPFGGGQVREWTWTQALGEARSIAAYLKAQDWEPGSRVAILSRNCAWWILSDLAIWMAGHVSVPIYPSLRAQTIRRILEHAGVKACFVGATDDRDVARATELPGLTWIAFPNARGSADLGWQDLVDANQPIAGCPIRTADEMATIIYTSGTTGAPKGVMHRFGSLAYNAKILTSHLALESDQRVLSYLPLAHIVERVAAEGLGCILGWHLFFTEGLETFLKDIGRARPTLLAFVPRLLVKMQQGVYAKIPKSKLDMLLRVPRLNRVVKRRVLEGLGFRYVRYAACGAAPLPVDVFLWYRNLGLPLLEGYGMTETMITHLPHPSAVRPGWVGVALDGVETRLGANNELLVRSPMNMIGYYREPQMTAESFTEDGFFKTGDVVTVGADGQTQIVSRVKEQFKTSKGKYVVPAPIEARLMEDPAVEACCLMGSGQPSPFAVVTLSDAAREGCREAGERRRMEESLWATAEAVNAVVEPFERLSMIVVVDGPWTVANGLLTPTMKVRRGFLEARYQQRVDEWRAQGRNVVWDASPADGDSSGSLDRGGEAGAA